MERRIRFFQPLAIRLTHWLNAVILLGMIASGLQIFGAYPAFAERGATFCCYPFDGYQFPEAVRLGGWLAGGLRWHFFLMWFLVGNGLIYVGYLFGSGEWRRRLFFPRDARGAWQMQLYYLRLREERPRYDMYNGLQKLSYTGVLLLGALSVVTGLALWKPVSYPIVTALFGGYAWARYWHFLVVWAFVGFLAVHVFMALVVDRESTRSMIVGAYRE